MAAIYKGTLGLIGNTPFGAKSISEIGVNGAAPAIATAIHDACGIWLREWHFTPEKILTALEKI